MVRALLIGLTALAAGCTFDAAGLWAPSDDDSPGGADTPGLLDLGSEGSGADGAQDAGADAARDGLPDTTGDGPAVDAPPGSEEPALNLGADLGLDTVGPCSCPLGCLTGGACRTYARSNIAPQSSLPSSCGELRFPAVGTTPGEIDTDSCDVSGAVAPCPGAVVTQSSGGDTACVLVVDKLVVESGATVTVKGSEPLIILARETASIVGAIDASAAGNTPGPGGDAGGVCADSTSAEEGGGPGGGAFCSCSTGEGDDCGGGGGSYGGSGAMGGEEGSCSPHPDPGPTYGNAALVPLLGGSGGASGHNLSTAYADNVPGSGGGGGGAIQISAGISIAITGSIHVGGGGGQGGEAVDDYEAAGGGGGSGGAVLLEAPQFLGSGWIAANGGGGAGCHAGTGWALPGDDAAIGAAPALGGAGLSNGGKGGDGAAGSTAAQPGEGAGVHTGGGGGGGGGLGRIRLNWYKVSFPSTPTLKQSGTSSSGAIQPL